MGRKRRKSIAFCNQRARTRVCRPNWPLEAHALAGGVPPHWQRSLLQKAVRSSVEVFGPQHQKGLYQKTHPLEQGPIRRHPSEGATIRTGGHQKGAHQNRPTPEGRQPEDQSSPSRPSEDRPSEHQSTASRTSEDGQPKLQVRARRNYKFGRPNFTLRPPIVPPIVPLHPLT